MLEFVPVDTELNAIYIIYLGIGGFILLFGFASLIIKDKLFLSEAFISTLFGVVIGPFGLQILTLEAFGDKTNRFTLEFSRFVIGIQCFAAGIDTGKGLYRDRTSLAIMLGPVLLGMWGISATILAFVFQLDWNQAMIIAACVTPTDPLLANAIVKGEFADRHVPRHLRNLLAAESGANDGLGFPLLLLPIFLSQYTAGKAIGMWMLHAIVYDLVGGIVFAICIGFAIKPLLRIAEKNEWIEKQSMLVFSVSLTLTIIGGFARLGIDEFVGCFVTGVVLSWDDWFHRQIQDAHIQDVLDSMLTITYFIYFGTRIPWNSLSHLNVGIWRLIIGGLLIVFFRRLPIVLLFKPLIPSLQSYQEAFFVGFFGPIGAGAVWYAMTAIEIFGQPEEPIFVIVSFIVVLSVLIHGGSVGLFHIGLTRQRTLEASSQPALRLNRRNVPSLTNIVVLHPSTQIIANM